MENLLTWYKESRALHVRCPLCGATMRLVLPDRPGAPLEVASPKCQHLTVTADARVTKVDMPDTLIHTYI